MRRQRLVEHADRPVLVSARLAAAGVVGLMATLLAPQALTAVLFGAWLVAAVLAALTAAMLVVGLSFVYRGTSGSGSAGPWAWRVAGVGTVVAAAGAAAWWVSGQAFGREPFLWQLAVASAFVVAAGVWTPRVRMPSLLAVGAVAIASSSVLLSQAATLLPEADQRGCIASSQEEAARICP